MTTEIPEVPLGSKEYVKAVVTTDRELVAQVVEIKVNGTWEPATWQGTEAVESVGIDGLPRWTRTARTTSIVDFAALKKGYHTIYVRFTDSPEVPIIDAGKLVVTAN